MQQEEADHLLATHAEILAERARLRTDTLPDPEAFELWADVLYKARQVGAARGKTLAAEAYYRLANQTPDIELACKYVIESVRQWPFYVTREAARLIRSIDIILVSENPRRQSKRFADAAFGAVRARMSPLRLTTSDAAAPLHDVLEHLTLLVVTMGAEHQTRAITGIASMAERHLLRQLALIVSRERENAMHAALFEAFYSLLSALLASGIDHTIVEELNERLQKLRNAARRT